MKLLFLIISFIFPAILYASIFGYTATDCRLKHYLKSEENKCYYCPKGTTLIKKKNRIECKGTRTIQRACSQGDSFEKSKKRCSYCRKGYRLILPNNVCEKK